MRFQKIIVYTENDLLNTTLAQMKIMELENIMNPAFNHFVNKTFGKYTGIDLLKAVWNFVINNFEYADDTADENLTAPKWLLITKRGDCDDFALFIKTVLSVFGVKSNYLLAGKANEGYSHILVSCNGVLIDGTNDKFNYLPDEYSNRKIVL